jgi:hypothetical protein
MLNTGKKVNDKERLEIKDTARKLLNRLTTNEFTVDRWAEKVQTASAVKKAVNDYLYSTLPHPTYGDGDIVVKTEILFNYFKTRYADYGRVA